MGRAQAALVALAVAAALAAAAFASPASAEIRVGLAVPLSGRQAATGLAMRAALEAAISDINAKGGLNGDRLSLAVEDDGCASATAEGAALTLIALLPAVVIGHPCSGAATAAAKLYGKASVLFISVGARHPDVTQGGAAVPVFRLAGRDDRQGDAAARWLLAHAPEKRIAIVHDRTGYARSVADGAVAALKAAGVTGVSLLPIVAGKPDYSEVAARLAQDRCEAMLFAGFPEEAAIVMAGIGETALGIGGLGIAVIGSDALATGEFAAVAAQARNPVQVLLPTDPMSGGPAAETDAQGLRARGALEAWLETARGIGATDAPAVAAALRGARIVTPTLGEIGFDRSGDLETDGYAAASAHEGVWIRDTPIGDK